MRPPSRSSITAVVLAGGLGRRLGMRDKARLRVRKQQLLEALLSQLAEMADTVIVVRRRPREAVTPRGRYQRCWDRSSCGPLAGIETGLRRSRTPWVLIVSVDSFQLPMNLPAQLAKGGMPGAYARSEGGQFYLHALIHRSALSRLQQFLGQGGRAVSNAWEQIGIQAQAVHCRRLPTWSVNTRQENRVLVRRHRL